MGCSSASPRTSWSATSTSRKDISGFNSAVPFILLLFGLVVMARERSRRGGSTADEAPPPDYLSDLPWWRRALPWTLATAFLIVYILFLANDFWVGVMALGLTLSLIFLSFVVVTGMGGMVSLAQGTFVLVAALTTGLLINRYEWAMLPAILVGVGVAVVMGVIVALPALRLGGLPFALATLALAFLGDQVLFQWNWLRNEQSGWTIPRPIIGPFDMNNNKTFAMFLLLLVGVTALLIHNLKRSSWGRAIAATRSSEIAANTSGVSVLRVKLGVFAISAAIAGVGGVFFASYQLNISNSSVVVETSLLWLATVVLFGIRRPAAAILAGIVSAASPVVLSSGFHISFASFLSWNGTASAEIPAILFGLGAVQLARYPDGVISYSAAQNYAAPYEAPGPARRRAPRPRVGDRGGRAGGGRGDRRRRRAAATPAGHRRGGARRGRRRRRDDARHRGGGAGDRRPPRRVRRRRGAPRDRPRGACR